MAFEGIAGALEVLERLGTPLAIAGSASGIAALARSFAALNKTREFKAHMEGERSVNKEFPGRRPARLPRRHCKDA